MEQYLKAEKSYEKVSKPRESFGEEILQNVMRKENINISRHLLENEFKKNFEEEYKTEVT